MGWKPTATFTAPPILPIDKSGPESNIQTVVVGILPIRRGESNARTTQGERMRSLDLSHLPLIATSLQLVAHYQPILQLQPEALSLYGFEALIRGPKSSYMESPDLLYGSLEEGYDRCVVDMACMTQILQQAPHLPGSAYLSMNIHLDTLYLFPGFSSYLLKILKAQDFSPSRLILEVGPLSEWAPGRGDLESVRELRESGVRFALDDFGRGSSNFDLLLELRPELLKISPYLTQGLMEDPWRQRILSSTCNFARKMGTLVVVKGLEKPSSFRTARWLGATLFQGYLFAVPGPIEFWQEVSFPQEWPLKAFMRTSPGGAVLPQETAQEPPQDVIFEDTGIWPSEL